MIHNRLNNMKKTDNIIAAIDENDIDYLSNVEFDVDCRIAESDNDTFFLYAISIPNFMYLDFFLEKNPDLNAVNDFGENILHCAVYSGSMERLKEMFCKLPISETLINSQSKDGSTPLLLAILLGHHDLAGYLIDRGADVCLPDYELNTPLHIACYNGCLSLVKKLIEHQANPFIKTKKGNYPLACAVNEDKEDVVKYLVQTVY